jgi:hypothetical protein
LTVHVFSFRPERAAIILITAMKTLTINRAPVLTLWASVVAERLGFDKEEALSLGKAVAGLNAQAKGRRLGIFKPKEVKERAARAEKPGEEYRVEICGRPVPVRKTPDGIRAFRGSTAIDPESVERYLESKFGDALPQVRAAMQRLAKSYRPEELEEESFALYERFRPEIPSGVKGWGVQGVLDVAGIAKLAKKKP